MLSAVHSVAGFQSLRKGHGSQATRRRQRIEQGQVFIWRRQKKLVRKTLRFD